MTFRPLPSNSRFPAFAAQRSARRSGNAPDTGLEPLDGRSCLVLRFVAAGPVSPPWTLPDRDRPQVFVLVRIIDRNTNRRRGDLDTELFALVHNPLDLSFGRISSR
jgi:hypothetical protein